MSHNPYHGQKTKARRYSCIDCQRGYGALGYHILSNPLKSFGRLLFPPILHLCKEFIFDAGEVKLCNDCLAKAPPLISPICSCCGHPFSGAAKADHLCGSCITDPPPFFAARAALSYESSTKEMIHQFK